MSANPSLSACVVQTEGVAGAVTYAASDEGVVCLHIGKDGKARVRESLKRWGYAVDERPNALARRVERELKRYRDGKLDTFDVPLALHGPAFHVEVWTALKDVPFGKVVTYGELAEMAGRPLAARAVGQAMANNPIPIIVPCHRVIGSSGKLHGFRGGLDLKARLLKHEGLEIKA